MAVTFETTSPANLLKAYKKAIDDGHVLTWSYDKDGDFTHTAEQWKYRAWMRPKIVDGELRFFILKPKDTNISSEIYAIYHGRLIESFLRHCDTLFTKAEASALAALGDRVK
jgi:hypothetical protein